MVAPSSLETLFASCPRGLEPVLVQELVDLGAVQVKATPGGVSFRGPFILCYRVNLESRLAGRVLWHVSSNTYSTEEDVYHIAYGLPWDEWFTVHQTIKVHVNAKAYPLQSLDYITLRIKDAVCDAFVKHEKARPTVDTRNPDIRIVGFFDANRLTLYLDTSGEPLFKRGWRKATGPAPLRENLAAGILRLSGWTPEQALVDPMCGSGTILVEAAHLARKIAPGLGRTFGFQQLQNFDAAQWATIKETSKAQQTPTTPLSLYGFDRDGQALQAGRVNLHNTGLLDAITLQQKDVVDLSPPAPTGVMVTNPPYGVRSGDQNALAALYPRLGDMLKQTFPGWRAYLLSADRRLPKLIRLSPSRKIPLFNGDLECRLYEFVLVRGGHRKSWRKDCGSGAF